MPQHRKKIRPRRKEKWNGGSGSSERLVIRRFRWRKSRWKTTSTSRRQNPRHVRQRHG